MSETFVLALADYLFDPAKERQMGMVWRGAEPRYDLLAQHEAAIPALRAAIDEFKAELSDAGIDVRELILEYPMPTGKGRIPFSGLRDLWSSTWTEDDYAVIAGWLPPLTVNGIRSFRSLTDMEGKRTAVSHAPVWEPGMLWDRVFNWNKTEMIHPGFCSAEVITKQIKRALMFRRGHDAFATAMASNRYLTLGLNAYWLGLLDLVETRYSIGEPEAMAKLTAMFKTDAVALGYDMVSKGSQRALGTAYSPRKYYIARHDASAIGQIGCRQPLIFDLCGGSQLEMIWPGSGPFVGWGIEDDPVPRGRGQSLCIALYGSGSMLAVPPRLWNVAWAQAIKNGLSLGKADVAACAAVGSDVYLHSSLYCIDPSMRLQEWSIARGGQAPPPPPPEPPPADPGSYQALLDVLIGLGSVIMDHAREPVASYLWLHNWRRPAAGQDTWGDVTLLRQHVEAAHAFALPGMVAAIVNAVWQAGYRQVGTTPGPIEPPPPPPPPAWQALTDDIMQASYMAPAAMAEFLWARGWRRS